MKTSSVREQVVKPHDFHSETSINTMNCCLSVAHTILLNPTSIMTFVNNVDHVNVLCRDYMWLYFQLSLH